jgi:ferredoxin-nitrate reductase
VSAPDSDLIERALRQAQLVVVQDAYHPTATSRWAHVILSAAQWSEKEGVMTNSERRVSYMPKLAEPPGEALPDWQILTLFARAMGFSEAFAYRSSEEIFDEFVKLTENTFCDCSGISYGRLKNEGPLQWPCPKPDHRGTERLYEDARFHTSDGKANMIPVEHAEPFETPDQDYPLWLATGRSKFHWHTMTRIGKNEPYERAPGSQSWKFIAPMRVN